MRNNRNMRRENRLLADIVEANGGVVTNKDNQCKLLSDWLDSYLTSQLTRWAPMFDGVSTFLSLDVDIETSTSMPIYMTFNCDPELSLGTWRYLLHDAFIGDLFVNLKNSNGTLEFGGCAVEVDGVSASSQEVFLRDGLTHTIKITPMLVRTLRNIGINRNGIANFWAGLIYDVKIDDELYSLNESFSEYPVATGSLSSTATYNNFVESDVVEIPYE